MQKSWRKITEKRKWYEKQPEKSGNNNRVTNYFHWALIISYNKFKLDVQFDFFRLVFMYISDKIKKLLIKCGFENN